MTGRGLPLAFAALAPLALAGPAFGQAAAEGSGVAPFTLSIVNGDAAGTLPLAQVYDGDGCKGGNAPPLLRWSAAPKGTKSFAVTLTDTTVPGGFWHWAMYDIPADSHGLDLNETPDGAKSGRNDFGRPGYGGACPPPGKAHQYRFTVWALPDPTIPFAADAPDRTVGDYLKAHALATADLAFSYKR